MKTYTNTGNKDTRSGFGAGLTELGKKNENVVALCADLTGSLKMDEFKENHPERFFQVGIAEANMIGIAAGMTIGGKIPFTGTFANFSTGRVYDQIRQSVAYSGKNVKICASHAGVTLGEDGATHQILEDIGLMKMLPGMTVINTCDFNQTKAATLAIIGLVLVSYYVSVFLLNLFLSKDMFYSDFSNYYYSILGMDYYWSTSNFLLNNSFLNWIVIVLIIMIIHTL